MKIQCSCGAKHVIEVTPEVAAKPVVFVCSMCGLDSSEAVANLVRQELASASPPPSAPPSPVAAAPSVRIPRAPAAEVRIPPAAPPAPRLQVRQTAPPPAEPQPAVTDGPQVCAKHPTEWTTEKCYVCSKPICPKCMELFGYVCSPLCRAKASSHGIEVPVYEGQASVVEARMWRRTVWVAGTAVVLLAAAAGFWGWYTWVGSLPSPVFSTRFGEPAYSGASWFAGKDQIVLLHGDILARHDMKQKKEIWSRHLVDMKEIDGEIAREMKVMQKAIDRANSDDPDNVPRMPDPEKLKKQLKRDAEAALELRVSGQNVWVASPEKLVQYDWETGNPVKEMAVRGGFRGMIPHGDEMLLLNSEAGRQSVTRINLNTCETRSEELDGLPVPPPRTSTKAGTGGDRELAGLPIGMPGKDAGKPFDPAKVAQQVQGLSMPAKIALPALLSNTRNQERTLAELNGQEDRAGRGAATRATAPVEEFSLVPAKDGFVQFSVRLLETRITAHSAMKARSGKSALDGAVSVAKTTEVANEILNDMQRERGGDIVQEDESRYQVTVRRPGASEAWSGEVIGPPRLFPLDTVNVVAGNKSLIVLDKSNRMLWQGSLTFNLAEGEGQLDQSAAPYGLGPCVERPGSLYVFDQGMLTAFDLATGNARWRYPSVGIAGMFFDDEGMIYLNTTTAGRDSIKFSRQIDVAAKDSVVVAKLEPKVGKVLWTAEPGGMLTYCSGKYLFTIASYMPDEAEADNPYMPDTGLEPKAFLKIQRLNPRNGRVMWNHFQQRAPIETQFDKNAIRLVFKKEVQVLRFLAWK